MRAAFLDAAARFRSEAITAFSVALPQLENALMAPSWAEEIVLTTEAARAAGASFLLNAMGSTPRVVWSDRL
jgi:hypothetical protein